MNKQLSSQELAEWEDSEGYKTWMKIQQAIEKRALPQLDETTVYQEVRQKIENRQKSAPITRMSTTSWLAIAAAIALLLTIWLVFPRQQHWSSPLAQQNKIDLPDGSIAHLNAESALSFSYGLLNDNRNLELEGEAFFEVRSGAPFVVNTPTGKVEVLGTQFNVVSRAGLFEVFCTEGKVKVTYKSQSYLLEQGQGFNPLLPEPAYDHDEQFATWLNGESTFTDTPLNLVLDEVARQFGYKIQYPDLSNRRYRGRFPHTNIEEALTIICEAMNLSYKFADDNVVLIEVK